MSGTVSTKTLTFSILAAIVVGAVGHYVVATSKKDTSVFTYPIELTPDNSGNTLESEVKDNALKCKPNNNKGCVEFKENVVGFIKFYLPGSKFKNKRCKASDTNKEVITKIELTTTGSGDKGTFGVPLDPWIKSDAFPGVDLNTGIVYESTPAMGQTQVYLANLNSHDSSEGTKSFWYRVTASTCTDVGKGPWVTDPRGDNKGMN